MSPKPSTWFSVPPKCSSPSDVLVSTSGEGGVFMRYDARLRPDIAAGRQEVYLGAGGAYQSLRQGWLTIDMSSIGPGTARKLAERAAAREQALASYDREVLEVLAATLGYDRDADIDDACRLLAGGKHVVTTVGYMYPQVYGPAVEAFIHESLASD